MHLGDPRTMRRRCAPASLLALLLALALLLSACGGGSTGNGTTEPTASAPEATTPPADATPPGTGTTPAPALEKPPSTDDASGGGGARNVRVPARFVVSLHHVQPRTITVPPFIAVQVAIRSGDGKAHRFVLQTPEPQQIDVWPERRAATMRVAGLRAGRYPIRVDFEPAGALVVGGDAGP